MGNNQRGFNPRHVSYAVCECNNDIFTQQFKLGRASMLANPELPRDVDVVVPVFACTKCGKINDMDMSGSIN